MKRSRDRRRYLASIAAMPKPRAILAAFCVAVAFAAAGCGGDDAPDPSISKEDADSLLATLQEVEANVDEQSCLVAEDRAQRLQEEIDALPDSVDQDVRDSLQRGALNLGELIGEQCEPREETTVTEETTTQAPTTTEETTTQEPTETQPTTPTQPPTTTTTPTQPGSGGGISPGSDGGL
jgi:hypothetical protein